MTDEERGLLDYIADHFDTDRIERDGVFVRTGNGYRGRYGKGTVAGGRSLRNGYPQIFVDEKGYLIHRLVYFWVHKHFPINHIDHINHDPLDNRPCNLRDVTPAENAKNRSKQRRNKTGHTGVKLKYTRQCGGKTWGATVGRRGEHYAYQSFRDKQEAIDFVAYWQQEFGYHENHGKSNTLQIKTGIIEHGLEAVGNTIEDIIEDKSVKKHIQGFLF